MITDKLPRKSIEKDEYGKSDALVEMPLPPVAPLREMASRLEQAMSVEDKKGIQAACKDIAVAISKFYGVTPPAVRVLGARPLEEDNGWVDETYGDYTFETQRIRLWMRTAVLAKVTSYGTLLSTLCHEICHHLDVVHYGFENTFHTRGFYERSGQLYHHVRGTPAKRLVWDTQRDGTLRINWPKTMKGSSRH